MAAHPKDFDCNKCTWKHCTPDNPSPNPQWDIDGEEFNVCPKGLVTWESIDWLRYHSHYEKGFLPVAGGMMNQTAQFVEAMEIIDSTLVRLNGK